MEQEREREKKEKETEREARARDSIQIKWDCEGICFEQWQCQ